jgi:putative ATPase
LSGSRLYEPGKNQKEEEMRMRLQKLWGKKYGY